MQALELLRALRDLEDAAPVQLDRDAGPLAKRVEELGVVVTGGKGGMVRRCRQPMKGGGEEPRGGARRAAGLRIVHYDDAKSERGGGQCCRKAGDAATNDQGVRRIPHRSTFQRGCILRLVWSLRQSKIIYEAGSEIR